MKKYKQVFAFTISEGTYIAVGLNSDILLVYRQIRRSSLLCTSYVRNYVGVYTTTPVTSYS